MSNSSPFTFYSLFLKKIMKLSYSDYQEYYHDIFDDIYNDAQGYKSLEQCHEETEIELKKQDIKLKQ